MKKCITLFAMLLVVGIAFAQKTTTNTKSTMGLKVTDADFELYDINGIYSYHCFTFSGCSTDSAYNVTITIDTADFYAGIYPDNLVNKTRTYIYDADYNYVNIARALTDAEVTITNGDITTFYNLTYAFVGNDSVHYNIDITFQVPYEDTYYESVATDGLLEKSYGSTYFVNFQDADYRYTLRLDKEATERDTLRFAPETTDDTCEFLVYAITDTNKWYLICNHYSGWLAQTPINDSTVRYVGEVLCRGDKKFYINCKHPQVAVKDVAMPTYKVFTEGNSIIVNNATGNRVTIYDATGRLIESSMVNSDRARFSLKTGVYLVRINGSTTKVLCW